MKNRFEPFSKVEREEMLLALDCGVQDLSGSSDSIRRDIVAELIQCSANEHFKLAQEIAQMVLQTSAGPFYVTSATQTEARKRVVEAAAVKVQAILNQQPK
jgi:hypothetical protein